ncbi:MAG: hypothetical protein WDN25_07975 [Acetobacteraceae bacterium]
MHELSPDFAAIMNLLRHIDHSAVVYLVAATVARFWHEHMWMIYVAMAYVTLLGQHH